jgi:hypothetical protein
VSPNKLLRVDGRSHQPTSHRQRLREASVHWLSSSADWTHAVTVTFRQQDKDGHPTGRVAMAAAIRHFLRVLAFNTFGPKRARKGSLSVGAVVVLGFGRNENPHAHIALACPAGTNHDQFEQHIKAAMTITAIFDKQMKLKPYETSGWIGYIIDHGMENLLLHFLPASATNG